jgi:hypothetical protein
VQEYGIRRVKAVGVYKYALICNYKARPGGSNGNVIGAHIFVEGEPCSQCPDNIPSKDKYTSLCGKLNPALTDRGMEMSTDKGSERLVPSQIISLCALVALSYFW